MADEIRAAYDELEQVASQFSSQSATIEQLIAAVRSSMDPLQNGGWIGRGSDAFFNEMNGEVLPASTRLKDVLDQANQVTTQISNKIKQAEEEASALFRNAQ